MGILFLASYLSIKKCVLRVAKEGNSAYLFKIQILRNPIFSKNRIDFFSKLSSSVQYNFKYNFLEIENLVVNKRLDTIINPSQIPKIF